jgi:hypothetical protein
MCVNIVEEGIERPVHLRKLSKLSELGCERRKIRIVEGNAKRPHLKKLTCFAAGVYQASVVNVIFRANT